MAKKLVHDADGELTADPSGQSTQMEDVPVKLVRASDKYRAAFEDAVLRLSEAQEELKEAKQVFKQAQAAFARSLREGSRTDPFQKEVF